MMSSKGDYHFREFNEETDKDIVYQLVDSIFTEFELTSEFHKTYLLRAMEKLCFHLQQQKKEGSSFVTNLWVLVNKNTEEIVGTVGLEVLPPSESYGEKSVELIRCYLKPEVRRFGLGGDLVNFAEKKAKELNFKKIYVFSSRNFKGAQSFYPKYGYRLIFQNDGEWNDNQYVKENF